MGAYEILRDPENPNPVSETPSPTCSVVAGATIAYTVFASVTNLTTVDVITVVVVIRLPLERSCV